MKFNESDELWLPCPSGALKDFAASQRNEIQGTQLRHIASALVLLLVCIGIGRFTIQRLDSGQITCMRVQSLSSQFMTNELDAETRSQILTHLESCSSCQQMFQQQRTNAIPPQPPIFTEVEPRILAEIDHLMDFAMMLQTSDHLVSMRH